MTITEPIPDLQWGKGSWQDYINNWRTRDTNWMQERLILRYQSTAARNAAWTSPQAGQVTYNDETKTLEMWRASASAWVRSLMFQYLVSTQDSAAGTNIHHAASGAKGILIGPTSLGIDTPTTNFLSGTAVIDNTGLALKTGTKTAKLSTDATNLVSDSPIKAPSLDITGAITGGVLTATSFVAPSATITNIQMSGTLSGGGILNGVNGTIGGVNLGTAAVGGANIINASEGIQSQLGMFYGDSTGAFLRQRAANKGGLGPAHVKVTDTTVALEGTSTLVNNQLQIRGGRSIAWYNAAGTQLGNSGVVIYDTNASLPAANYPEGTIWFS